MEYIYVLVSNKCEWEDLIIFLDEDEARTASIINLKSRVEIFSKTKNGYKPTYCYYKNGNLIET